jgi:allantoate deiminase
MDFLAHAKDCIDRCRALALHTDEPGFITRTFLSPSMHAVHRDVSRRMREAGMNVTVDSVGNLRGHYSGATPEAPVLWIGSHLDTVPHAGAFDGILGVVLGVKLIELLNRRRFDFAIEVVAFSEEEGVRFGFPFIGSRYLIGELDGTLLAKTDTTGTSVADAIRNFGLTPDEAPSVLKPSAGYFEIHIEQGPVLENLGLPLGVVDVISGQSRTELIFEGQAGHAGTTPMRLRHDALAGAAEWICAVEREALATADLVATVGRVEAQPGAINIIPGVVKLTLDIRHQSDEIRRHRTADLLRCAENIAARRGLRVNSQLLLEQASVAMDLHLTNNLARAVEQSGQPVHRMPSGAGHDAMIMARHMPATMLFLRSPGGLSHHPDESVLTEDVAAALAAGLKFLEARA